MTPRSSPIARATLLAAAGVALGSFLLALPRVVSNWHVSPDTIEFIGIANNWVHGRGWVDPVLYSTYLQGALPPIHGLVMRPPVISLLMAPAIALGASLPGLQMLQGVVAALIAGMGVMLARRSVSLPSAVAFGIAISWSPSWLMYSSQVLSEPLAVGALLGLIAAAPGAAKSPSRAALLGLLCVVAWLTRPNLALVLVAFGAATALPGKRDELALRNLGIALAVFGTTAGALHLGVQAASGFGAFANYGLLLQSTHALESAAFQQDWAGFSTYLTANADRVWQTLTASYRELYAVWFQRPSQFFIGWLFLPACIYAFRRHPGQLTSRAVALSGLGLLLVVLVFYGGPDPERLVLPAGVCFWLLAVEMLEGLATQLRDRSERWTARRVDRTRGGISPGPFHLSRAVHALLAGLPLYLVLGAFGLSLSATQWFPESQSRWRSFRAVGPLPAGGAYPEIPRSVCGVMDKDALVAASHPWNLYLWCGNATLWLPPDLDSQTILHQYLDAKKPAYIVSNPGRHWPPQIHRSELETLLGQSPKLERLSQKAGLAVYRVRYATPQTTRWDAPPAIARMGR